MVPPHPSPRAFVAGGARLVAHGGLLVLLLALAGAALGQVPGATPRVQVPVDRVDLGQVVRGEVREVSFALDNAGAAVLKIVKVDPG